MWPSISATTSPRWTWRPTHGEPVSLIPLGPKPKLTVQRLGEMHFHDAWLCFQHWQSCASCHPDARVDGLNWDLMNDGMGNPKNSKSMLLAHQTPPSMASGVREDAETGGPRGLHPYPVHGPAGRSRRGDRRVSQGPVARCPAPISSTGELSDAAQRGKELFFSERIGCARCHPEPLYTDLQSYNVYSRGQYDRNDEFDTPTLIECWRTAPYMHDGRYTTLKQLFTTGKHGARSGAVDELTEQQLDDLIEYVKSL